MGRPLWLGKDLALLLSDTKSVVVIKYLTLEDKDKDSKSEDKDKDL